MHCNIQLLYPVLLAGFLVTVGFTALETATSNAAVDKDLFEQQDKLEPSRLPGRDLVLAARCRLQPVSLGKHQASKAGLCWSQIQTANRLPKGLVCAAASRCPCVLQIPQERGLRTGVPVPQSSGCSLRCLPRCWQGTACWASVACSSCLRACFPREPAISECRAVLHKPVSFFTWGQQTAAGQRGLALRSDGVMYPEHSRILW